MTDTVLRLRYSPDDTLPEIGVDEAGRGSFWGPLMAGAVCLPDPDTWTEEHRTLFAQIRDSKRISAKKRAVLYHEILRLVPECAVGRVDVHEINEHGIQWANKEAFRRAVRALKEKKRIGADTRCRLVIDGMLSLFHGNPHRDEEKEQAQEQEQDREFSGDEHRLMIDGDNRYLSVATASILAKVAHDEWIQAYCKDHPECAQRYDLVQCKGYGTAKHREAIQHYGGHELHRVVYIQYWLPGSTVSRLKRTALHKKAAIDENKPLFQFSD